VSRVRQAVNKKPAVAFDQYLKVLVSNLSYNRKTIDLVTASTIPINSEYP